MSDDHCSVRLPAKIRIILNQVSEERFNSRSEAIRYAINVVYVDEFEEELCNDCKSNLKNNDDTNKGDTE